MKKLIKWLKVSTILTAFCGLLSIGCLLNDQAKNKAEGVSAYTGYVYFNSASVNSSISVPDSLDRSYTITYDGTITQYVSYDTYYCLFNFSGSFSVVHQSTTLYSNANSNFDVSSLFTEEFGFSSYSLYFNSLNYINSNTFSITTEVVAGGYSSIATSRFTSLVSIDNDYISQPLNHISISSGSLTKTGYDNGYEVGYEEGYGIGYNAGKNDGYSSGYEAGYNDGSADSYQNGYNDGYQIGYQAGYDAGVLSQQQAITDAYNNGYSAGYNAGSEANGTAVTIFSGILQVALVPINFFLAIFNFEILGINLSGFIRALFTIAITIIVIKTIFGGKGASDS